MEPKWCNQFSCYWKSIYNVRRVSSYFYKCESSCRVQHWNIQNRWRPTWHTEWTSRMRRNLVHLWWRGLDRTGLFIVLEVTGLPAIWMDAMMSGNVMLMWLRGLVNGHLSPLHFQCVYSVSWILKAFMNLWFMRKHLKDTGDWSPSTFFANHEWHTQSAWLNVSAWLKVCGDYQLGYFEMRYMFLFLKLQPK